MPSQEHFQEKQGWPLSRLIFPLSMSQSWRDRNQDNDSCVLHADDKVNRHQIKQDVKKFYDTDVVNTPDGDRKVCVQLAPDSDPLDVTNKTRTISTEPTY